MTPELISFLGQFGLPLTMLVVVLTAGARGTWRWGREVEAANLRADKAELAAKEWQAIALTAMRAGTKAVEKVAEVAANGKTT
jgi:hypothetical protein